MRCTSGSCSKMITMMSVMFVDMFPVDEQMLRRFRISRRREIMFVEPASAGSECVCMCVHIDHTIYTIMIIYH